MNELGGHSRRSRVVATLAAATVTAGVAVLAYRGEHPGPDHPDTVSALLVMALGMVLLVLPYTVVVARLVWRRPRIVVFVGPVSLLAAVVVATRRPGNLAALWFVFMLCASLALLVLVSALIRLRSAADLPSGDPTTGNP